MKKEKKIWGYFPEIQPFTAKAPTRRLDVNIEYCTLGLT
jgi:hypothetical protein